MKLKFKKNYSVRTNITWRILVCGVSPSRYLTTWKSAASASPVAFWSLSALEHESSVHA